MHKKSIIKGKILTIRLYCFSLLDLISRKVGEKIMAKEDVV